VLLVLDCVELRVVMVVVPTYVRVRVLLVRVEVAVVPTYVRVHVLLVSVVE
jgi:hypothetical protein